MKHIFKYSIFYYIQPIFLIAFAFFFWASTVSGIKKQGLIVPILIIILFGLYLFYLALKLIISRYSNPCLIIVDQYSLEVRFLNGCQLKHGWEELTFETKQVKRKIISVSLQSIDQKKMVITNDIRKFDELLKIISSNSKRI